MLGATVVVVAATVVVVVAGATVVVVAGAVVVVGCVVVVVRAMVAVVAGAAVVVGTGTGMDVAAVVDAVVLAGAALLAQPTRTTTSAAGTPAEAIRLAMRTVIDAVLQVGQRSAVRRHEKTNPSRTPDGAPRSMNHSVPNAIWKSSSGIARNAPVSVTWLTCDMIDSRLRST